MSYLSTHPKTAQFFRLLVIAIGTILLTGCGTMKPHEGRVPFRWTEGAPNAPTTAQSLGFEHITSFDAATTEGEENVAKSVFHQSRASLRPGDVIAFTMSHQEAWSHLRAGRLQKLPYDLLRYGHLAIVIPGSTNLSAEVEDLRLLQVALFQPVNASESLDYLRDKNWEVHRPPDGSVDPGRLRSFADIASERGGSWWSYDVSSMFGLNNAKTDPETPEEIDHEYSCATLVVAALHYSGFELHAVHRGGWLDVVSPRQVVESRGIL